jgi:hypothetical protein
MMLEKRNPIRVTMVVRTRENNQRLGRKANRV